METKDILDVEIWKTGLYNGDEYTETDLEDMAESYAEIGAELKPYLKLGHNSKQPLLDGQPAAGWIKNVRKVGQSLKADFFNIPAKIADLISAKAYGRMSPEIYWNLKSGEKTYRRVLKAVALLGADTPACKTLDDFINLYTDTIEFEAEKNYHIIGEEKMDEIKFYTDRISELEKKYADSEGQLKTYSEKIQSLEKERDELKSYSEKIEAEKKQSEIKVYMDDKLREGKIIPAQVQMYSELALVDFAKVQSVIEAGEKQIDYSESSNAADKTEGKDAEELLYDRALKYSQDHKVEFKTALIAVSREA